MFLNFDFKTLDKMSDGVVLIDRYGQVTDFNDAAKPWIPMCLNAVERLAVLIATAQRENTSLPLCMELFEQSEVETQPVDGPALPDVHLCSDGQGGYALLFTTAQWTAPVAGVASLGSAQSHLISDDIRHELSELILGIAAVRANGGVLRLQGLGQHAQHLRTMFTSIDELSRLADADAMVPGERMAVVDLLTEVVAGLPYRHCDYSIQAPGKTLEEPLGQVYGSAKWLLCALQGLIESLEVGLPRNSRVALTVRQNGGFLALSARPKAAVDGQVPADHLEMTHSPGIASDHCAQLRLASSVRVPLARRIVEIHGGQLDVMQKKVAGVPSAGITGFTLQLPTGSPVNLRSKACEDCLVNQQAALYARDLAALMPAVFSEAEVSDEERCMLWRMTDDHV